MVPRSLSSAVAAAMMADSYDLRFVALSILISMLGAYAALELAERIAAARGQARAWWEIGGGTASALGTWSMHYTGMLAFSLPVVVLYDWPTVAFSFVPAFFTAVVALSVVNLWNIRWRRALVGSFLIGGGIAALHYIAMAAMRFDGMCRYSPALVTVSVILPMVLSLMALELRFLFRHEATAPRLRKAASILLLGAANPAMHYTGMAATTFSRAHEAPDFSHAVSISCRSDYDRPYNGPRGCPGHLARRSPLGEGNSPQTCA
jgi:NO-binding membrane sensor protein with MHYT domain